MRHRNSFRRLGVDSAKRKALLRGLCIKLAEKGEIKTTLARAKELKNAFEKLISFGKKEDLHYRRLAYKALSSDMAVAKIFNEHAVNLKDRNGGYTRLIKLNNRLGDNAEMALIQIVDHVKTGTSIETNKTTDSKKKTKPEKIVKDSKPSSKVENITGKDSEKDKPKSGNRILRTLGLTSKKDKNSANKKDR